MEFFPITVSNQVDAGVETVFFLIPNCQRAIVDIDLVSKKILRVSLELVAGILFEVAPMIDWETSYPSFLVSRVEDDGTVLARCLVVKRSEEWRVEE